MGRAVSSPQAGERRPPPSSRRIHDVLRVFVAEFARRESGYQPTGYSRCWNSALRVDWGKWNGMSNELEDRKSAQFKQQRAGVREGPRAPPEARPVLRFRDRPPPASPGPQFAPSPKAVVWGLVLGRRRKPVTYTTQLSR